MATQLLESEYGYDVTFEVGEQSCTHIFKAHSVILYQRSPYFRQKLTNANKKNNVIEIKLPHIHYSGVISLENFEASAIFNLLVILWGKSKTPNLPPNLKEWTDGNFKSLKTSLLNCLPHIRYFQIPGEDILKEIKPYRNILEENIWDDMVSKLIVPNLPITSLVLPPPEISSWIDRRSAIYNDTEIPYEFKLLLRGSRDGFTGETFHRLCDNILVVVKVNGTDEILGGYNPLSWISSVQYATTADSFIFSLKNGNLNESILGRVTNTSKAIWYSSGPWFSDNSFGSNNNTKTWYHSSNYGYDPIRSINGWFSIDEYEKNKK
ncbi:hypothetical protein C2G38_2159382 [Gigaspora rosea]|uniref:BTB domain-containing protein n=1 Tax=Gigaspora rosea TaxID=44941 RepID=A0A397W108_9GLOM|nr:hypothetical protein C2G38_2159382 [Gigaspora rosea]